MVMPNMVFGHSRIHVSSKRSMGCLTKVMGYTPATTSLSFKNMQNTRRTLAKSRAINTPLQISFNSELILT